MIAQQQIHALFVAWQQPVSRRYYPVARLLCGTGEHRDLFEFCYIHGAELAMADGFRPLLAFPHLDRVYRARELFPFFTNRLMSRKRPDFPDYVRRLGLEIDSDPMAILARGGTRATDTIELFPLPHFDPASGRCFTHFWMHGYRHLMPEQQARVLRLVPDEPLIARAEPDNQFDPNAVQLISTDGIVVGYVPRYLASDATHLMRMADTADQFRVFVELVNQDPAPMQQRLLCRLESVGSARFIPCAVDVFRPIPADAVRVSEAANGF